MRCSTTSRPGTCCSNRSTAKVIGTAFIARCSTTSDSACARGIIASLSRRELEVLTLIDDGRSNKEVASALGVTPETVKTHLKSVFGKLSVERRAQVAARARSLGWL